MKKLSLIFSVLTFLSMIVSFSVNAKPADTAGYFPIELVNGSQIADDAHVYLTIKASKVVPGENNQACIMAFDKSGMGTCDTVKSGMDLSSYSVSLATLPAVPGKQNTHEVYLPPVASGRIYVSIGNPMRFMVNSDNPSALTIPDPDGFKSRDVNYYTLYDKVEFTYNDAGTWINPTAVDFFSLPLGIEQDTSTSLKKSGFYSSSRAGIVAIYNKYLTIAQARNPSTAAIWNKLQLVYDGKSTTGSGSSTLLRIMAPAKAMETVSPLSQNQPFNPNYLVDESLGLDYISTLWNYYKTHTIKVDCSELKGDKKAPVLSNYIFTGQVNSANNFVFSNGNPKQQVSLSEPNTIAFFAGAGGSFDAANHTAKAIIVRELTSAFEVGLIPAANGVELSKAYLAANKALYYSDNRLLGKGYDTTGPWYDLYSKALHGVSIASGVSQPIYTFAYDDALSQDGTLHDPSGTNPGVAILTIGDMTGTPIPTPFDDPTIYSLTVTVGQNKQKERYPLTINGKSVEPGKPTILNGVKMPLIVNFDNKPASIYIKYPMVLPDSKLNESIVITKQSATSASIAFPAPPPSSPSV